MILTGLARLGRDCEVRFTQQGDPVGSLNLAFNYGRKDDQGNRPTQWISASLWGNRVEALQPYLTQGTLLDVVLEDVHIETYKKNDGTVGTTLRAKVLSLEFAGGKRDDQQQPTQQNQRQAQRPAQRQQSQQQGAPTSLADMQDDTPF